MKPLTLASVLILIAGCSPISPKGDGDGGSSVDASSGDGGGGADADPADAPVGMATVTVTDETATPVVGTKVAFNRPDGTLIEIQMTDANGMATGEIVGGGSISVVQTFTEGGGSGDRFYVVQTLAGVLPGDNLRFGPTVAEPNYADLGTATVNFTSYPNAGWYQVGTACSWTGASPGGGGISTTFNFNNDDCSGTKTTLDLLAIAYDDVNLTTPLAWALVDALAVGSSATNGSWNASFNRFEVTLQNSPIGGQVADAGVVFYRDNVPFRVGQEQQVNIVSGGSATFESLVPPTFPSAAQASFEVRALDNSKLLAFTESVPPGGSVLVTDLATLPVPIITSSSVDLTTTPPTFSWTQDGTTHMGMTDALLNFGFWANDASNEIWQWIVISPPDATSPVIAPSLPTDFAVDGTGADRWPPPTIATLGGQAAGVYLNGDIDGWDELRRNNPFSVFDNANGLSPGAPTGAQTILSAGGLLPN